MVKQCGKRAVLMRINKITGYAISWLHSCGKGFSEIADELKVLEKDVSKYIVKNNEGLKVKDPSTANSSKSKDLMITKTLGKGLASVAIMTHAASELNDSLKNVSSNSLEKKKEDNIFRPNNE